MLKNFKKKFIYLFILVIPFLLFFVRLNPTSTVKFSFLDVTSIPIKILSVPFNEIKKILYYHRTFNEYKRLRQEVDVLKARLVGFDEVSRENNRLLKLLEFKQRLVYSSVAAKVIGRSPTHWNSSVLIDKGSRQGIKKGMPVVNALGVVGKVIDVGKNASLVVLLTDPQFSAAALVTESGESALVSGTLQGICRLRYVDSNAKIRVGEKVVTSQLSSSFPEGLLIGTIIKIEKNPESESLECLVRPAVALSQVEEVLIILK